MRTEVTVAVLVMVVTSDDFRVNEEGGPKIEFLTKAKWERSSHVLGGSGGMPPRENFWISEYSKCNLRPFQPPNQ